MNNFFCFECMQHHEFKETKVNELITIKGEEFEVEHVYFVCSECGLEMENPNDIDYNLRADYEKFREIKGWLTPEEMLFIRKQYDLSQRAFAAILGMSYATVSNYETGALQNDSSNIHYVMANDPRAFYQALLTNKSKISNKEFELAKTKIIQIMKEQEIFVFKKFESDLKHVGTQLNKVEANQEYIRDFINHQKIENNQRKMKGVSERRVANASFEGNDKLSIRNAFSTLFAQRRNI